MATIEQRIYDGNRAKEVLENEAFNSAFEQIEREIFEQWKQSPARDEEGRQRLYQFQAMLAKLRQVLTTTLETGKLATMDLCYRTKQEKQMKVAWMGLDSAADLDD